MSILTPDEVRIKLGLRPTSTLQHVAVSEKPWGDYTEADYSLEQWHKACLIHLHDGPPTSKAECKLPVRTPDGTLNRNGVHAAAAALAGARGGVNAPMDMKRAAARQIMTMYNQLDEKAPPSMGSMMQSVIDRTDAFLEHISMPGLTSPDSSSRITKGGGGSFDESKVKRDKGGKFSKKAENKALDDAWLDKGMIDYNTKVLWDKFGDGVESAVQDYAKSLGITDPQEFWSDTARANEGMRVGLAYINEQIPKAPEGVSPSGTQRLEIYNKTPATKDGVGDLATRVIPYSGPNPHTYETKILRQDYRFANRPRTGRSGFHFNPNAVLDPSRVHNITHMDKVKTFLAHFGIRGMKWGVRRSEGPDGTVGSAHPAPAGGHGGGHAVEVHVPTEGEKAAAIAKKVKKSGLESITNEEMQVLVTRMRLERDLATISADSTKIAKGREFVNRQLKTGKTINDAIKFANSPAGHLLFAAMGHKSVGKHTRSTANLTVPKLNKMKNTKP